MKTKEVAIDIFYTKNNEILLQDRKKISKAGEEWGFFGGQIEDGETPEEALVREIKEELDYNLQEFQFIGQHRAKINDELTVHFYVFITPLDDKFDKFRDAEGTGMRIYPLEQTKHLKMIPGDSYTLELFKKATEIKE